MLDEAVYRASTPPPPPPNTYIHTYICSQSLKICKIRHYCQQSLIELGAVSFGAIFLLAIWQRQGKVGSQQLATYQRRHHRQCSRFQQATSRRRRVRRLWAKGIFYSRCIRNHSAWHFRAMAADVVDSTQCLSYKKMIYKKRFSN